MLMNGSVPGTSVLFQLFVPNRIGRKIRGRVKHNPWISPNFDCFPRISSRDSSLENKGDQTVGIKAKRRGKLLENKNPEVEI